MAQAAFLEHPDRALDEVSVPFALRRSARAVLAHCAQWRNRTILGLLLVALVSPVAARSGAAAQETGPYSDGCYYLEESGQLTQKRCPQSDGSDYFYIPNGGQWDFALECAATSLFTACLWVNGLYIETYPDGSTYMETADRRYLIRHADGSRTEAGYYDASGMQKVYRGQSTNRPSDAMRNRSRTFWWYQGWAVQTVVQSNPAAFYGLITLTPAANEYASCLHLHDSSTDFDDDGKSGFNELAEHCTLQAYGQSNVLFRLPTRFGPDVRAGV